MLLIMDKIKFGQWLQIEREKRGLSQAELARLSGLDRQLINKTEGGVSIPATKTFIALAKALNYDIDYVLEQAELTSPKTELSAVKRAAIYAIQNANEDDVEFINDWLAKRENHVKKLTLQPRTQKQ